MFQELRDACTIETGIARKSSFLYLWQKWSLCWERCWCGRVFSDNDLIIRNTNTSNTGDLKFFFGKYPTIKREMVDMCGLHISQHQHALRATNVPLAYFLFCFPFLSDVSHNEFPPRKLEILDCSRMPVSFCIRFSTVFFFCAVMRLRWCISFFRIRRIQNGGLKARTLTDCGPSVYSNCLSSLIEYSEVRRDEQLFSTAEPFFNDDGGSWKCCWCVSLSEWEDLKEFSDFFSFWAKMKKFKTEENNESAKIWKQKAWPSLQEPTSISSGQLRSDNGKQTAAKYRWLIDH